MDSAPPTSSGTSSAIHNQRRTARTTSAKPYVSGSKRGSVRTAAKDNRGNRPQHDLHVEPRRPVLGIVQIQTHHLVEAQVATAIDLPKAGEPGRHGQPLMVPVFIV